MTLAYRQSVEEGGSPVWCQDEAGPYQAIPQAGARWQPRDHPARQPHEYTRNGTATLRTLFHPATGTVRAYGITSSANAVLHPWLQAQVTRILSALPAPPPPGTGPLWDKWERWRRDWALPGATPSLRLILVWDNLAGHLSSCILRWLVAQGVLPLYTPLSGSWLNRAESVQRIIVRRALAGQHPQSPREIITRLEDTVAGWNAAPTPFVWQGKRGERRQRARQRRLGGSAAVLQHNAIAA